jgi:hypothetical protein
MQTNYIPNDHIHNFRFCNRFLQHTLLVVVLLVATFLFFKCVFFSAATQTLVTQENATTQKIFSHPKENYTDQMQPNSFFDLNSKRI